MPNEEMTIPQWMVCGFLAWPCLHVLVASLRKNVEITLAQMLFAGTITGAVGGVLGWLWNW